MALRFQMRSSEVISMAQRTPGVLASHSKALNIHLCPDYNLKDGHPITQIAVEGIAE